MSSIRGRLTNNLYLVWLEWPEECFRVNTQDLSYLRKIVPKGSKVVQAKTRKGFLRALKSATHVITWYFEEAWFSDAPRLKVLATPSAGKELLPKEGPNGVRIHFGGFHGEIMAESVTAFLLAWCRGFFVSRHYPEGSAVVPRTWLSDKCRSLAGTKAVIVGYGRIGHAISDKLEKLGCKTIGFRRKNILRLKSSVSDADWFIMALPATKETDNLLNDSLISHLPKKCVIVNVGRGNSIDEKALLSALKRRRLSGAYLDVVKSEPLNTLSRMNDAEIPENLFLMPHSAAFTPEYVKMCFKELKDEGLI